jgi:hypothetical protein
LAIAVSVPESEQDCYKPKVGLFGQVGTGRGRGQEQDGEDWLNLVDKWFTGD